MTSLGDAYGARRDQRRVVQLVTGGSLLLAGGVAFGLGLARVAADTLAAAGVGSGVATAAGFALAGLLLPAALVALRTRLPGDRGEQLLAPGGGLVGVSVAAVLTTAAATGAPPSGPTAWLFGAAYVTGIALLVGSALASALEPETERPGVSYRRSPMRHDGAVPADGGEDRDDDLGFPLDDE